MTLTGVSEPGAAARAGLIERDDQWDVLDVLVADCVAGHSRVALVAGPVASGKTELLHAFAVHSGLVFLKAECSRSERALPFGVASQLLRTIALPAETSSRMARLLDVGDPATPDAEPDADSGEYSRVLDCLCQAVLAAAEHAPVLIGVDDVQHMDLPSLRWLLYLVRRLGPAKVLLVLTQTATPQQAHSPLHSELVRHPHCVHVDLPLLSGRGVRTLFTGRTGSPSASARAIDAYSVSGGNPLLAKALLADQRGAEGTPVDVGPNFRQALLSCLYRCDPAVLPVARALAVLGESAAPTSLGSLAGVDVEAVPLAIDVMNAAGLLDRGRFRHPAARSAVVDDMSAEDRKALYLGAARLSHDQGAPATEVAPHLVMADDVEHPWTVPVLEEAAEHALRDERIEAAVRYLELAGRACADDRARIAIAAKLARAEWRIAPAAAARRLPALIAAMHVGDLADRDVTELVGPLLWHGRVDEAADALDLARRSSRAHDAPTAADLRAVELWVACSHPPLARTGVTPIESAKRGTGVVNLTIGLRLKSTAALATVLTYGDNEHVVTDAEHVLQAARPSDSGSWGPATAVPALLALVYADRLDIARSWCDRLIEDARIRGTAVCQAMFAAVRAEVALRQGDLSTAFDQARTALTFMSPTAWGTGVGFPLGSLITAATRMGRHSEAATHVEQPVPDAMFQSRYGLHYLHARGLHYLATDRHYAALADFLSCGELMSSWGLDMPGLVPWRTSAAQAWLQHGGNPDEARRLINEQLAKLGPGNSRTRGVSLRLLAATSQVHSRPQLLAEAVTILEDGGDHFELALALADLSRAHQALREHRRAWTVARRAWHVAKACDAAALCEELLPSRTRPADHEPAASRSALLASLTDAERRVAALAAVGYTNREIAGKLFITPSTIEQHLTRVYRKLNVKYRKNLPADLHTRLPSTA